jgi:hypothetical protein
MSLLRLLHAPRRRASRLAMGTPPAGPAGASTSYQTGTAPSGGPLPAEAQILLRVMGEDLDTALALVRGMSQQDRDIYGFYLAQCMELIYRVGGV